jgi:hypothetical protein
MLWGGIFERRKREKREREILSQVWDIRWCGRCQIAGRRVTYNGAQHVTGQSSATSSSHPSFPHLQPATIALPRGETISKFIKPRPSFPLSHKRPWPSLVRHQLISNGIKEKKNKH